MTLSSFTTVCFVSVSTMPTKAKYLNDVNFQNKTVT
jgi:hypothetical protein